VTVVPQSHARAYAGLAYIKEMVKAGAKSTPIPMSLHLDHGARAIADVVVETPTGLGSKFLFLSKPFVDFVKIG